MSDVPDGAEHPPCERVIPYDQDAEMAVLGCMMSAPDTIDDVTGILEPEMFYHPVHVPLYRVLSDMHAKGQPIDLLIVSEELRTRNELEAVGGQEYMIQLAESFGDLGLTEHYARIVTEKHRLRELIRIGSRMTDAAYAALADSEGILGDAAGQLEKLSQQRCEQHVHDAVELVGAIPASVRAGKNLDYITTGLLGFDDALGGLECGGLTVIGGATSVGKTSLGLAFAIGASTAGIPCLFVSVEMRAKAIAARIFSTVGGQSAEAMRDNLRVEELENLVNVVIERIGQHKLFIASNLRDYRDIASMIRATIRKYGVRLVVVDYLQLCRGPRTETRNLQVADMIAAFKGVAQDTDSAVVVLSQFSRGSVKENRSPVNADLRDSGAIEQDADVVGLLHRDAQSEKLSRERAVQYPVTLRISKNRNGELRSMELVFHPATTAFTMGTALCPETPF